MSNKKDNGANNQEDKLILQKDMSAQATYLSQKCQRLASALYAVTRFLPADEPLRDRLRSHALSLVETTYRQTAGGVDTAPVDVLVQINNQLSVAKNGDLLSSMNYQILNEEINTLVDQLNKAPSRPGPELNNDFLAVDQQLPNGGRNKIDAGSSNNINMLAKETGSSDSDKTNGSTPGQSAKDKRRQKILDLFAETDEITVNDATEVINGYSTKTIQRDLKSLVEAGKLEKHGKRRWTSYTKA